MSSFCLLSYVAVRLHWNVPHHVLLMHSPVMTIGLFYLWAFDDSAVLSTCCEHVFNNLLLLLWCMSETVRPFGNCAFVHVGAQAHGPGHEDGRCWHLASSLLLSTLLFETVSLNLELAISAG